MNRLASTIRNRLDTLAVKYDQRLQEIDGYSKVPERERLDAARYDLRLVATCLEARDDAEFVQYIQSKTRERMVQGFSVEALMQAIVALEETLLPLVSNVKTAKFLWRALSKVRDDFYYQTDDQKSDSEEKLTAVAQDVADLMDMMDIALWELDTDYRIVGLNRRARDIYGQDIIGGFCYHCAAGLDRICPNCPTEKVYQGASSARSEHQWVDDQGNRIYVDHIATPLKDEEGNLTGTLVLIIDITERKQAEEELRESEQRYRQLFEEAGDVVYTLDEKGFFTYINPPGLRLTGYTEEELIGVHFTELVHPEWRKRVQNFYLKQFRERTRQTTLEFPAVDRAGETRWVEQTVTLLSDGDWVTGFQSIVRDATERKQAEEAAQRRLGNLSAIVEAAAQLSGESTVDGLCRRAVELGRRKLGIDRMGIWLIEDENNPTRLRGTFGTDERGRTRDDRNEVMVPGEDSGMRRVLTGQSRVDAREEPLHNGQGRVQGFGWHTTVPLEGRGGRLLGLLCADSLLTQRVWDAYTVEILKLYGLSVGSLLDGVRMQETLQDSEAKYSAVVQQAKDGVVLLQGDLCIFANPAMENILGYTPEEMENTPFVQYVAPESRKLVADQIKARLAGQDVPTVYEAKLQHKDNTVRNVELSGGVVQYQGNPAAMEIIRDITERKRLEQQLQESERKFREIVNRAMVGIFRTTPDGQVVEANPAVLKTLRFDSMEQVHQIDLADIFVDQDDRQRFQAMLREGPVSGFETRFRRGDGQIVLVSVGADLIRDEEGNPQFLEGILEDITERKRLQGAIQESLERRAQQVRTSTEVAQEIAAAPALDELFHQVVKLIRVRFDYYHTQIFRYEPAFESLVLVAGYGEAGERMLAEGHQLAMGHGVVGMAAATGRSFLISDVAQSADWTPHPHLPKTKGELAVPIKLRDEVLGILDVQSDQAGALTEDDQLLLEGLCGQIAIAIQNTRLRQEMEENLRELNAMYRTVSREGWETLRKTAELPGGYFFNRTDVQPADDLWTPEIESAMKQETLVAPTLQGKLSDGRDKRSQRQASEQTAAVAPLLVHGEIIGALGVYDDPQTPLSSADLELVESVSEQVALALESARLFEQTQAALSQTEMLYRVSRSIGEAASVEDIVQGATIVARSLGFSACTLTLITSTDEEGQPLYGDVYALLSSGDDWVAVPPITDLPLSDQATTSIFMDDPSFVLVIEDLEDPEADIPNEAREMMQGMGMRAAVTVGLSPHGRPVGFLSLIRTEPLEGLSEDQMRRLRTVADQVAVALESRRLFEQTQAALDETQALYQASAALNAVQSYDDVLNALRAYTLLGQADRFVSLSMFDRPWVGKDMPDWIVTIAKWGALPGEVHAPRYALQDFPLASGLLYPDAPTVIADVGTDSRLDDEVRKFFFERYGARGIIAVPLVVGGQWIGYVDGIYGEVVEFPETQVRRLAALAAQATVTIQSLNQLSEIQGRAHDEQVLRQIMAAVNASEDLTADLPSLAQHVCELIPADLLALALYTFGDPDCRLFSVGAKTEDGLLAQQDVRLSLEGSGFGWVINHGDHWLDRDLREAKPFMEDEHLVAEGISARLILPLQVGRQTLGALMLGSTMPDTYLERHVPVLRQIADQMALALERVRLLRETRAALEQVQAVHRRYLRESWQDYLAARGSASRSAYVYEQAQISPQLDLDVPEMDEALTRRELVVSDGSGEGGNTIASPISLRGQPIGVLAIEAPPDGRSWSEEEIALIEAVSAQLALAMENTRLFEETQMSAQRERTLREATERVRAASDMESLLRLAAQEIRRALGASRATIRLGLESRESKPTVAGKQ